MCIETTLVYFNIKTERGSAPERPERRQEDIITTCLQETVTSVHVFKRFRDPSSSVTSGELVQLNDRQLMT